MNWDRKGVQIPTIYEDKYCLVFETTVELPQHEPFKIFTYSKPIITITHSNQENAGHEWILWDTACASISRVPFMTTPKLRWSALKVALSVMFREVLGRGLSEQNLNFLFFKIMLNSETPLRENVLQDHYEIDHVHHLKRVANELMMDTGGTSASTSSAHDKKPSLIDWILMAMQLAKIYFPNEWEKGYIHGFVSKSDAEQIIFQQPAGTFMLRFSETRLCALSIVYVMEKDNRIVVDHVLLSESHLRKKSLQEAILKMCCLDKILCIKGTTKRKQEAFIFRQNSIQPDGYKVLEWIASVKD